MPYDLNACGLVTICGLRVNYNADSHFVCFQNSNEINHYASAGGSSLMYLNWVGGDVSIARNAIYAKSAGNVGIGTTSPTLGKLQVNAGGNEVVGFFGSSGMTANQSNYLQIGKDQAVGNNAGEISFKYVGDNNASNMLSLGFYGNGQKLNILPNGNTGIGTTSPNTPLHITAPSGDGVPLLRVCGTAAGSTFNWAGSLMNSCLCSNRNWVLLIGQAQSTKNSGYIGYNHTGTDGSNSNFLTFGHYGNDNLMNLMADGKLGIGTTAPLTLLHTNSSTDNLTTFQAAAGYGVQLRFRHGSSLTGFINSNTTNIFSIYDGSSNEIVSTTSTGKFGIGCSLPRNKTEIIGGTSSPDLCAASCDLLKVAGSANSALNIGSTVVSPYGMWLQVKHQNTDNLTYPMVFQPCGGNTGIGIMNPTYKLHVNGTFYAAGSSIKYKEGICNYDTDSCLFMCLKPVTYQYKDEWQHLGRELKSQSQIGLIAEDVAQVMPELAILVNEDDEKVVRNVDYEKLSVVLLKEVQKLRQEVDELKNNK